MKKNKGFSLIELLVVISIIGVLTTVLVMNFVGSRERARDAQTIQNLNSLKNALRMYYNDNQSYPLLESNLQTNLVTGGYIESLGTTSSSFYYAVINNGDGFVLVERLGLGAGDEDLNSQRSCGIGETDGYYAVCAK